MTELIDQVAQQAGISPDQAGKAVQTVAGFLKQRLPGPVTREIDEVLGTAGPESQAPQQEEGRGGFASRISGMFRGERKAG